MPINYLKLLFKESFIKSNQIILVFFEEEEEEEEKATDRFFLKIKIISNFFFSKLLI